MLNDLALIPYCNMTQYAFNMGMTHIKRARILFGPATYPREKISCTHTHTQGIAKKANQSKTHNKRQST